VRKRDPLPNSGDVKTVAAPIAIDSAVPGGPAHILSQFDPSVVYHDTGPDGSLWSRGAKFKLRMNASGTDFVPFFGSSAPQDYPLHFALAGATIGGDPIPVDASARPARNGDVVRFDRGAIDEVYEITPRQLEQEFVIDRLPATGELLLHVAIDTQLQGSVTHDGFEFANEFGRVHCGSATVVDARGRTLALASELAGGDMTIRVPASFVAQAAFPLVIDPWWFTVDLDTNASVVSLAPDVAHPVGPFLFACWENVYSATDHDVLGELVDGNGTPFTYVQIDLSMDNWVRPRAGHVTASDRVLVVAEVGAVGSRSVWGRSLPVSDPYNAPLAPAFQISDPSAAGEKFHPEVGGDPYPSAPSYFCVVYERAFTPSDHDILVQMVDANGALHGTTNFLENSFSTLDEAPAISKTDDTTTWNIAWQRLVTPTTHDILGARVAWNGAVVSPTFTMASTAEDEKQPAVSGPIQGTDHYMIAFEFEHGCPNCVDGIDVALFDGASLLHRGSVPQINSFMRQVAIESNGRHVVCCWAGFTYPSASTIESFEILPIGSSFQIGEHCAFEAQSGLTELAPRLVNHEDSDAPNYSSLYFAVWNRGGDIGLGAYIGTEGGSMEVYCGQDSNTLPQCPCGNTLSYPIGCPNSAHPSGAQLTGSGTSSVAGDSVTFDFAYLPPNVHCLLFEGPVGAAYVFGDGMRCIGSPTVRFPMRTADGTGATGFGAAYGDTPISAVGGVPVVGGIYGYQLWYRDPAAFCTAATTNLTNGIKVTWTP
jgi:hypothetical protein